MRRLCLLGIVELAAELSVIENKETQIYFYIHNQIIVYIKSSDGVGNFTSEYYDIESRVKRLHT